jgi:meso-butanediol dehydrogenase/(S,S)-butanediol dehydrogenase/diacetyl reductase
MPAKVIVVTGANGGLGQTLAKRLASDGDTVVLLGRTLTKVQEVAKEIGERAHAIECVVSSPGSVKSAFAQIAQRYGKIDALINNAAIFKPSLLEEATDEQILDTVGSNLTGAMLCARAAIGLLNRGGHIINVGSESVVTELPHLVLYQATKAGLERFSSSLNLELAEKGIRVTVVRAGQMFGPGSAASLEPEAAARMFEAATQRGFNLMTRGTARYEATTDIFRLIIDSPPDVYIDTVAFCGRPMD